MKSIIFTSLAILFCVFTGNSQTATDFTANDCSGTSHHLFAELDAGKIVVISFVMPCSMCVGPTQNAMHTVQGYATSNPGKVIIYISDDQANTSCTSLNSWAGANGLWGITTFSDSALVETQYGATAMPKIVVLAGADHKVIFTQDNSLNTTSLKNAIDGALNSTTVSQVQNREVNLSVFPNPATTQLTVSYSFSQASAVSMDIFNIVGAKVKNILLNEPRAAGTYQSNIELNSNLGGGIYFLKLNAGGISQTVKFTIAN